MLGFYGISDTSVISTVSAWGILCIIFYILPKQHHTFRNRNFYCIGIIHSGCKILNTDEKAAAFFVSVFGNMSGKFFFCISDSFLYCIYSAQYAGRDY